MSANRNIEGIYPLSPQQQGMLFETLRTGGGNLFVEQEVHSLAGAIDLDAFEHAWHRILDRHAILRSAFVWKSCPEPLQVVFNTVDLPIEYHDWRRQFTFEHQTRLQKHLEEDRVRGFDLTRAPMLRLALFHRHDDTCDLVWSQHHILYDGWCRPLLFRELVSFYDAYARGLQPPADRARPYSDYIAWLGKQDFAAAERFWRTQLEGFNAPSPLGISIKGTASAPPDKTHDEIERRYPAAETTLLESFARQQRVTVSGVVHSVWAILLARYSDSDDVVYGSTVSGRPAELPGVEDIVGPFITTLPFRVRIDRRIRFLDSLHTVQTRHAMMRRFEYCSAGQIHQWSQVPGGKPLYESVLVFENYPSTSVKKPQVAASSSRTSRFIGARTPSTLTLLVSPATELSIRAVYRTDRFGWASVSRLLDHFAIVLRRAIAQPELTLGQLLELIPDYSLPQVFTAATAQRGAASEYLPPANPIEERLTVLVCELLGLPRVSMADRFLDLGGHSLLATQLVSRLRQVFQIEVSLRAVFESGNLRQLAGIVEESIFRRVESLSEEQAATLVQALTQPG